MATIQLGGGNAYPDAHCDIEGPGGLEAPSSLVLKWSTPRGDDQRNFPIALKLSHDELLTLISDICEWLKPPALVSPPPRRVEF